MTSRFIQIRSHCGVAALLLALAMLLFLLLAPAPATGQAAGSSPPQGATAARESGTESGPNERASSSAPAGAQTAGGPAKITFVYDHPQRTPPHYSMVLDETGAGKYKADGGVVPGSEEIGQRRTPVDRSAWERPFRVPDALRDRLFAAARSQRVLHGNCELRARNVAFMGHKHVEYSGPEGQGGCDFNSPADKPAQVLGDSFVAIAYTLEEGKTLSDIYKHDHLGLDREMEAFVGEVKEGRAMAVLNLQPLLEELAGDETILDRVRKRARSLLTEYAGR